MKQVLIIGTGGHAQMIWAHCQAFAQKEFSVAGWLESADYTGPPALFDRPIFRQTPETLQHLLTEGIDHFIFGLGMVTANPSRALVYETLCDAGLVPMTFIHPHASVALSARIAPGCFIGDRAIIQPYSLIGEASIINTGAIIEHHCNIGTNTHVGPGAILCGQVTVGRDCMIGAASVILQSLTVGAKATVGAGSVVISPIPSGATVAGNPAKALVAQESSFPA